MAATGRSSSSAVASAVLIAVESLLNSDEDKLPRTGLLVAPLLASLCTGNKCVPRKKKKKDREEIQFYSPEQFRSQFKVSIETFQFLCEKLGNCPHIMPSNGKGGRPPVSVEKQIQLTLWLLQNPEPVHTVAVRFNVSQSTVVRITKKICEYIIKYLYPEYVFWPSGGDFMDLKGKFQQISNLPGVIGVIDATHIPVKSHLDEPKKYRNIKGQHSVILQAVCRDDMRFTDVYCNAPGRLLDAHVLVESPLYVNGESWCGSGHLVGDASYPLLPWLLTPYEDNGYLTHQQQEYNYSLNVIHGCANRAFAALKGRFLRLKFVDMKDVGDISKMVLTACVIHNICIMHGDDPSEYIDDISEDVIQWQNVMDNDVTGAYKRETIVSGLISNTPHYINVHNQAYEMNSY